MAKSRVVSGSQIDAARKASEYGRMLGYLFNNIPNIDPIYAYASVGMANIKLPTAANLWLGIAYRFGECMEG